MPYVALFKRKYLNSRVLLNVEMKEPTLSAATT